MQETNCRGCGRVIDPEDDVKLVPGPLGTEPWHEECAENPQPAADEEETSVDAAEAATEEIPPEPVQETKAPVSKDELIRLLVERVELLTGVVGELRKERAATPVRNGRPSKKGSPRADVWYEFLGYPTEKFAPQCLRIMRCLAAACPENRRMTEIQIYDALMGEGNALGAWNYRQDPYYIFRYYKSLMVDADYLRGPFNM